MTILLVSFGGTTFSLVQSLALLCFTGLLSSGSGWWLFSLWIKDRPASSITLVRSKHMRNALNLSLFGCLLSTFLLALFGFPAFRLVFSRLAVFGEWFFFLFVFLILITSLSITFILEKYIKNRVAAMPKM